MQNIDILVQNYFEVSRTKFVTEFFVLLTKIFDFSPMFLIFFSLILLIVYMRKGFGHAFYLFTNLVLTVFIVFVLKELFDVARPVDGVIYAHGGSFPSYHATISTVLSLSLYFIFKDHRLANKLILPTGILVAVLVSESRVYLGVHWLSDVLAGILIGICICVVTYKLFKKNNIL